MVALDDKTLHELKLSEARFHQQLWASDAIWNQLLQMYQTCISVLPMRKKLQPLARRYEKNPIRLCERLMGRDWFKPPKKVSSRQVQTVLEASPSLTKLLAVPESMHEADARLLLKTLNTLAARPAGRKRSEIYARALELSNSGKSFHQICLQVIPSYKDMSAAERHAKRDAMRSGVNRLRKALLISRAQGPTKSPR